MNASPVTIEVPLANLLLARAIEESGVKLPEGAEKQVLQLAETLLWHNRVILVATIDQYNAAIKAQIAATAPAKRRGRPRKAEAKAATPVTGRKRGRPRKNPLPETVVPVSEPTQEATGNAVV